MLKVVTFVQLGEKKHWQKNAQSLSKDVQRLMATSDESMQLREEIHELKFRVEVRRMITNKYTLH